MTTSSNSLPTTSISTVNRKWAIVVGAALGIAATGVTASAVQSGSASARELDPATAYSELTLITEWARAQGLGGLSPASLRSPTD